MIETLQRDICLYGRCQGNRRPGNPYLDEVLLLCEMLRAEGKLNPETLSVHRRELIERYAFSIPTPDILGMAALHSPLVEVGAGSGYWAHCLALAGADVIAYDKTPPDEAPPWPWGGWEEMNPWFDAQWYPVRTGDETAAARHPGRSLFLCWPLYGHSMAYSALSAYLAAGGTTLVYIGDPSSSGDADFHTLKGEMPLTGRQKLWGWPGIDDWIEVRKLPRQAG